jgi:hypothetical protein
MENQAQNETKDLDRLLDVNKQMTTLSAGATVLIATFLKDIFPDTSPFFYKVVAGVAFLIFFASIVFSIAAMLAATSSGLFNIESANRPKAERYTRVAHWLFVAAVIVFAAIAYVAVATR